MEFFIFVACVMAIIALVRTTRFGALDRRVAVAERDAITNENALRATVRKFNEHIEELEALRGRLEKLEKLEDLARRQPQAAMSAPLPPLPDPVVTPVAVPVVAPEGERPLTAAAQVRVAFAAPIVPRSLPDSSLLDAAVPAMVWLPPDAAAAPDASAASAPLERTDSSKVASSAAESGAGPELVAPPQYVRTAPMSEPAPSFDAGIDWEQWLGVRGAAVLGGIVLALAALLFFKYSIEHSLISPSLRVVLGVFTGLGCIVGASRLPARYAPSVNAVTGGGVVVLYATFWAARALRPGAPHARIFADGAHHHGGLRARSSA